MPLPQIIESFFADDIVLPIPNMCDWDTSFSCLLAYPDIVEMISALIRSPTLGTPV